MKKSYSKAYFGKKSCFLPLILQKKHIYQFICALIVGGELMHYEEEEEEWEEEDEETNWLDEEW
ncbi:MAG: hypothetical protein NWE80_00615 [Candidatus Bathyarchaeota archaeon]|nr:hypothetical protein [Candidatus Bathyarchaeota archaeon]